MLFVGYFGITYYSNQMTYHLPFEKIIRHSLLHLGHISCRIQSECTEADF